MNKVNNNNYNSDKNLFNKTLKTRNNSILEPNSNFLFENINLKKKLINSEKEIKITIPKKRKTSYNSFLNFLSSTPKNSITDNLNINNRKSISTTNLNCKNKIRLSNYGKFHLNNNINNKNNSSLNSQKLNYRSHTFNYEPNDALLIAEEDKIFDLFKKYLRPKNNLKKKTKIQKTVNQKKKNTNKKNINKILKNVYKEDKKVIVNINNLKKKKEEINLRRYQENLLNTISPTLTNDARKQLGKSFYNLRKKNPIIFKTDYYYLKDMEEIEKNIIMDVNNNQKKFINLMISNDNSNESSLKNNLFKLPNIKFKTIIRRNKFSLSPIY